MQKTKDPKLKSNAQKNNNSIPKTESTAFDNDDILAPLKFIPSTDEFLENILQSFKKIIKFFFLFILFLVAFILEFIIIRIRGPHELQSG